MVNPILTYYPSGNVRHKIIYFQNGKINYECYYNDLYEFHNEVGFAYIEFYEDGTKFSEEYFINGKRHNINGAALIYYHKNNEVECKCYYLNGKEVFVKTDEEFQKYIKRLNIM